MTDVIELTTTNWGVRMNCLMVRPANVVAVAHALGGAAGAVIDVLMVLAFIRYLR